MSEETQNSVPLPIEVPFASSGLNTILWRRAISLPWDFVPPEGADIRLALDPSFTANEGGDGTNPSDESAIAAGFVDETGALNCLDIVHGRFRGLGLPRAVVSAAGTWKPERILIEPTPFFDLLADTIKLLGETEGIAIPRIVKITRGRELKRAKARRIRRIETDLLQYDPPLLKIRRAPFVEALLDEVERFDFESRDNRRRPDNCLDSLALLAGF
jgi:hypothetical protein